MREEAYKQGAALSLVEGKVTGSTAHGERFFFFNFIYMK